MPVCHLECKLCRTKKKNWNRSWNRQKIRLECIADVKCTILKLKVSYWNIFNYGTIQHLSKLHLNWIIIFWPLETNQLQSIWSISSKTYDIVNLISKYAWRQLWTISTVDFSYSLFQENRSTLNPVKAIGKVVYHKPVPDFEKIYHDFQASMEKKKNSRMLTVMQPFSFEPNVQRVSFNLKLKFSEMLIQMGYLNCVMWALRFNYRNNPLNDKFCFGLNRR